MATQSLFELDEQYIANTYHRLPFVPARARGSFIYDSRGKQYLDLLCGIAALPLGHLHPEVKKAITAQSAKYLHLSNYFCDENQVKLAKLLVDNTHGDKVFYANSGAEAADLSIKLARKWARKNRNPNAHEIICMENSFHGRTYGALSATGQDRFHAGIGPMLGGIKRVPYNDVAAARGAINRRTAAIMVEPVQCEGGINIPLIDFLTQLKHLCKKHDLVLIVDEIQTGLGRSGRFLASEHSLMIPDITLLGKSLGGGLPLSAVLTTQSVADAVTYGDHGTTMGGNPLACAAGLATLQVILKKKLVQRAEKLGDRFRQKLFDLKKKYPIENVRNMGLVIGFDVTNPAGFVEECLKKGLILNKVQEKTVRLLPPLNLSDTEFKDALTIMEAVLKKMT